MPTDENQPLSPSRLPRLPTGAGERQIQQALKDITLQYNQLYSAYYQQRWRADEATDARPKKKHRAPTLQDADTAAVLTAGRHFAVMFQPWVDEEVFELEFDPDYQNAGLDLDEDNQRVLSVARSLVPARILEQSAGREVWSVFLKGMSDMRSTVAHRVRECAPAILNCLPCDIESREARTNDPRWQSLLGYDTRTHTYSSLPPIPYEDPEHPDTKKTFRSPILIDVLRCILLGKGSLSAQQQTKGHPKRATFAQLWGAKETTPGLIAFAAIMAHWMISPDIHFEVAGAYSGSKYREDFHKYRKLVIGAMKSRPWMKETITVYNNALFPSAPDPKSAEDDPTPLDNLLDTILTGAPLSDSDADNDEHDGEHCTALDTPRGQPRETTEPDDEPQAGDEEAEAGVRRVRQRGGCRAGSLLLEDELEEDQSIGGGDSAHHGTGTQAPSTSAIPVTQDVVGHVTQDQTGMRRIPLRAKARRGAAMAGGACS